MYPVSMEQFGRTVFSAAAPATDRGRGTTSLDARLRRFGVPEVIGVRVRNLSAGGLMAELPDPIAPDAAIEIELDGLGWIAGRVAWQTEGRIGIAFDRDITPEHVRR